MNMEKTIVITGVKKAVKLMKQAKKQAVKLKETKAKLKTAKNKIVISVFIH